LYRERDVILEERRMRTDNSPFGLFWEELAAVHYKAHPYGKDIIGHFSDMANLSREDVREFYDTYYVPQNMTAAIVGDVYAEEIIPLIDAYFARIPRKPDPPSVITEEPEVTGIRRIQMNMGQQPYMVMRYHTVPEHHPDELALDLLAEVLGGGTTSRLYRSLVEDRKLAANIYSSHPTRLYAGYFYVGGAPVYGVTPAELEQAVLEELALLDEKPVTDTELDAARARWKVYTYNYFASNLRFASLLSRYDQGNGGWRSMFTRIKEMEQITTEELSEVALRYLDPGKRTVGHLEAAHD
jgi:predicted Zn-dependent peptidase